MRKVFFLRKASNAFFPAEQGKYTEKIIEPASCIRQEFLTDALVAGAG